MTVYRIAFHAWGGNGADMNPDEIAGYYAWDYLPPGARDRRFASRIDAIHWLGMNLLPADINGVSAIFRVVKVTP